MENSLYGGLYNPDILMCLANLSSDEVFTPPEIANQMLDMLPQELFKDPNTKFLDPACKSGVFLREIVKRLNEGLKDLMPDTQERLDHIFHNQVYGIAITELTSLLSRRSLYCSKYPDSPFSISHFDSAAGNVRYGKTKHRWKNGSCVFCGASQAQYERDTSLETHAYEFIHTTKPEEILKMKFDVVISNPPYQLSDGGAQSSAKPIYHLFVQQAQKLNPRYLTMIIPARWYAGGKGLEGFRKKMLIDNHVRILHDFINASDCFSGVEIKGGVCYFLWERDNKGTCQIHTHVDNEIVSISERPLLEKGSDIFIRHSDAIKILNKISQKDETSFSSIVRPAMTFGFRTFFKEFDSKTKKPGYIKVYANRSQGYIKREKVKRSIEWIDLWKVIIPEAIGVGNMRNDVIKPIIAEPGSINTETYIMNGPYKSEEEAKNVCSYINTKFFHFLLGLKKNTQHTTQNVYSFIPMQDFSEPWTDEKLYKKYKLSKEEISFIEGMVLPNGIGGENDA